MPRLIPPEVLATIPGLEVDLPDDPVVHVRLFHPIGSATWWILAASHTEDGDVLLFGWAEIHERELGFASLRELEGVAVDGLRVERDVSFIPTHASKLGLMATPLRVDATAP